MIVAAYLNTVAQALSELRVAQINAAVRRLHQVRSDGGAVYICGNGGSAATAAHFACDLLKAASSAGRPRLHAIALTSNAAVMTAYANDDGFEDVFVNQISGLLCKRDAVVAISTSGRSVNVNKLVGFARAHGTATIGLTCRQGGMLPSLVDVCVDLPPGPIQMQEDVCSIITHAISMGLRESSEAAPAEAETALCS
jgi:D-sedoheptulose 7-phosphate isomerase